MSIGSPYLWYQIDTAKSQLWPLLTTQSHERRLHYSQCRGKPPLPCSVKHNAKCQIKVFSVWKHLHNEKVVLGYYHFPSLWMWRPIFSIHRGEFGDVPVNGMFFLALHFCIFRVYFNILHKKYLYCESLEHKEACCFRSLLSHFYFIIYLLFIWVKFV